MLFIDPAFLFIFLPVVVAGFWGAWRLGGRRAALGWMLAACVVFYGSWDWRDVPVLAFSLAVNFGCGWKLAAESAPERRRLWLAGGLAFNLGLLVWYKYAAWLFSCLAAGGLLPSALETRALPLGISFFTFQQIVHLMGVWRTGRTERSPVKYVLFVAFFPHLIAGPIVRPGEIIPQLQRRPRVGALLRRLPNALTLIILGLAKKLLLADALAPTADAVFQAADAGHSLGAAESWLGLVAYGMQIYFDFSAYSEIALGLALLFGVRLPVNFDAPYRAASIVDFWRRWHMTLSRFLRDFLYLPLGGGQCGPVRQSFNLAVTMLLGGLWHGAHANFLLWGAWHGGLLALCHAWWRLALPAPPRLLGWALTFASVTLGWAFFRASTTEGACHLLASAFGLGGGPSPETWQAIPLLPIQDLIAAASIQGLPIGGVLEWFRPAQRAGWMLTALATACALFGPRVWTWVQPQQKHFGWGLALVLGVLSFLVTVRQFQGLPSPFIYFGF